MNDIGIVDEQDRHVGVVTLLQLDPAAGAPLYGWTVALPGNPVRSTTERTLGREAAVAAAVAAATKLGVVGARASDRG